jgi:sugar phosphate isomerase/epimerase
MVSPTLEALSRRQFVQAAAASVLTGGVFGTASQTAPEADDDFGGFTVGAQSYTFREFDLEQTLKRIQELGLKHVEFYNKHANPASTPAQVKALLTVCGDYGIKPVAYGVHRFTKDADASKKIFEFAKAMGLQAISADPDPESFDSLDKLCEEYKIAIAIHPHGPVGGGKLHRWYSAKTILDAVKDHHPLIGSCLDTGHLIRADQLGETLDPAEEVRVMGARNFGLHLKDHDNAKKTDVVFGKGALDVPALLKALRAVKFQGFLSIEYEANPKDPTADVRDCVAVFKEAVKRLG